MVQLSALEGGLQAAPSLRSHSGHLHPLLAMPLIPPNTYRLHWWVPTAHDGSYPYSKGPNVQVLDITTRHIHLDPTSLCKILGKRSLGVASSPYRSAGRGGSACLLGEKWEREKRSRRFLVAIAMGRQTQHPAWLPGQKKLTRLQVTQSGTVPRWYSLI